MDPYQAQNIHTQNVCVCVCVWVGWGGVYGIGIMIHTKHYNYHLKSEALYVVYKSNPK